MKIKWLIIFVLSSLLVVSTLVFVKNNIENFHHERWMQSYIQAMKDEDYKEQELQKQAPIENEKSNQGFHIYINLDKLEMYVYNGGELLKTYPVSGGKTNTPSPLGKWKIINKDTWGEGFGGAWMGFNVPWGLYGIHGTIEPWYVGTSNSSEGCIRMKNADVKELFKLLPYGTSVEIVYENIPFRTMRHGDVGSDVLEVEKALKEMKYYGGSTDGVFGDSLTASIKKFQKENGLYVTGKVNNSTYNLIMESYNESKKVDSDTNTPGTN